MEHDLSFGSFLTPSAEQPDHVVDLARLTEELGLDLASVQDHPYQARFLDTWTLLSVSGPDDDKQLREDGHKQLREAADLLADTLLSHLAYEERELVEPLARLGFY